MVSKVKKIVEEALTTMDKVEGVAPGQGLGVTPDQLAAINALSKVPQPVYSCATCTAWVRDDRDQYVKGAFGGCARSGKTTSTYGEDRFVHYTTDTNSCSMWEPKA